MTTAPVIPGELVGRVVAFLGQPPGRARFEAQVAEHISVITHLAHAYTRGSGFEGGLPSPALRGVIVSATARLVANPEQIESQVGTVALRGGFKGWSLAELTVLNAWRGVAR